MTTAVVGKPKVASRKKTKNHSGRNAARRLSAKTVQMNIRIDESLKDEGDQVFESLGYTPSRAVRALWAYVVKHENNAHALQELMDLLDEEETEEAVSHQREQKRSVAEEGRRLIDDAYAVLGITSNVPDNTEERLVYYDELLEEALLERATERGLL